MNALLSSWHKKYSKNNKLESTASLAFSVVIAVLTIALAGHIIDVRINNGSTGSGQFLWLLPMPAVSLYACLKSVKHSSKHWKVLPAIGVLISVMTALYLVWITSLYASP